MKAELMNDEQRRRYDFCENELSQVIYKTSGCTVKYYIRNGREIVDIVDGSGTVVGKVVVTDLDLLALTWDVVVRLYRMSFDPR